MKKLYLVRHAKSSWEDASLADFDRPLNPRGKRNAPMMGKRLAERGARPDCLISSPAKRAIATARRIAARIGFAEGDIVEDERIYLASPGELLVLIRELDDGLDSVMIFGHNPGLTDLANLLTDGSIANVPTSAYVEMDFDLPGWSAVAPGSGRQVLFDFPKRRP